MLPMLPMLAVLARLYLVKDWRKIRQALPSAGAELAVLVVPVVLIEPAGLPVLVRPYLVKDSHQIRQALAVLNYPCWQCWC